MQTLNTAFEQTLTKTVNEEIEKQRDTICAGQLSGEDYKLQCGILLGMRQVLGYFDEVNKILSER